MTNKRDSPFSSLERLRDQLPAGPQKVDAKPIPKGPARAVVRYERKHRGGKEVTVVEKLELKNDELTRWCRELKQALGCGKSVEKTSIVLQGDQRSRLPDLLTAHDVDRMTMN